ncbi:ATP-dependent DNA helicase [Orrella sp. 11846]|uniref:ATP-dependent DNA helicase n=1 Tax=Orrella sp. 11846 TaxID=3409913 RepID=UPI003B5A11D0
MDNSLHTALSQDLKDEIDSIFGQTGRLQQAFEHYISRQAQVDLAGEIAQTIEESSCLIAEAGTGIGKTWAYLVPALLRSEKTLISTGTKTLQDQLFEKDLPQVSKALGLSVNTAVLKGRANYVCHYHLKRANEEEGALTHRKQVVWLRDITRFAASSNTGDKAQLETVPEDADIWRIVTSTRETCLGQECPHLSDCFVYKARRQAQQADLVVINHALFMADAALRDEGVSELLPQADLVVFDEAHQLPDVATRFLAQSISTAQITDWARQVEVSGLAYARETVRWRDLCATLTQSMKDLRLVCDWVSALNGQRVMRDQFERNEESMELFAKLCQAVDAIVEPLKAQAERHIDLEMLMNQGVGFQEKLQHWRPDALENPVGQTSDAINANLAQVDWVDWVELFSAHVRFNSAPLSVAQAFSKERQAQQAWVFLSATLSVKGDFQYFTSRLGLEDAKTVRFASPFDYGQQALLCVPETLPQVNDPTFNERFVEYLLPLIQLNDGGCLILCTTLRAIETIGAALEHKLKDLGIEWPVLRQGQQSRAVLLSQFRREPKAILIGSASFREGVDLAGEHLTLLAIDKLPFAPPDDPVLQARIRQCEARRGSPFMELQIPEAAIALKQGAGRLIRTEKDWGVLVIGDRRLVEKSYGRRLWQGLPPFQRTREQDVALSFIREKRNTNKDA